MTDARHGLRSTYQHGCRCTPCRAANANYQQARRQGWRTGRAPLGSLVPAVDTLQILRSLEREHLGAGQVAALLGLKARCVRICEDYVRLRTALRFRRLARLYLAD